MNISAQAMTCNVMRIVATAHHIASGLSHAAGSQFLASTTTPAMIWGTCTNAVVIAWPPTAHKHHAAGAVVCTKRRTVAL